MFIVDVVILQFNVNNILGTGGGNKSERKKIEESRPKRDCCVKFFSEFTILYFFSLCFFLMSIDLTWSSLIQVCILVQAYTMYQQIDQSSYLSISIMVYHGAFAAQEI